MSILGTFITNRTDQPFYIRKVIKISKEIKKATADVCGLGQFLFHINGEKVGDHELDPGWTDYRKYIEYVTFDVTELLHTGANCVGAEVGNGWFIMNNEHYTFSFPAFMPPNPNPYVPFGKYLMFAMRLSVEYTDGTSEVFTADETFKVAGHPTIQSNVYGSETMDGSLKKEGWSDVAFDDEAWEHAWVVPEDEEPKGEMISQFQPPIKVIKSYDGRKIGEVNGRAIYDFGQNMSGMLEVVLRGRRGDTVKLYPAEKLSENGDVDQVAKGWVTVDTCITCILGEDDVYERFRQKFAYFAGRYVGIEKSSPEVEIKEVKADAITSAWKKDGFFESDDVRYNQIYDIIEKTVEANMVSVHTDCPTIERFAWQEPNHLMAPSIMFMKDGSRLWEKFLLDMRMQQHTADDVFRDFEGNEFPAGDGLMPSQCPCYIPNVLPVPGMGSFYDIIPWGSTCILGTRWHYLFYGDRKIIEDNYDAGMRYLNYLKTKVNEDGFINHGLGDWGNPDKELARENIETAFLYADACALAEFAQILGKEGDKTALCEFANEVRNNYNEKLLTKFPDGTYAYRSFEHGDENVMTQACEALPLYFGLVPEEYREDVILAFRKTLEGKGCFAAGEIGLPYIIQTAAQYGMNDLIADFITREEHPSYYAFVKDGMTTLGEYWEQNPRSHCHDMMGHIIEWYYNGIAGIKAQKPGFKEILIRPCLPEGMNRFRCVYDSVSGKIEISVMACDGEVKVSVNVDSGIVYELDVSALENRGKVVVS